MRGSGKRGWRIHLCDGRAICLPPPQRPSTTASVQPPSLYCPGLLSLHGPIPETSLPLSVPLTWILQPTDPISVLREVLHWFPITCKHLYLHRPHFTLNSKANLQEEASDKINQQKIGVSQPQCIHTMEYNVVLGKKGSPTCSLRERWLTHAATFQT